MSATNTIGITSEDGKYAASIRLVFRVSADRWFRGVDIIDIEADRVIWGKALPFVPGDTEPAREWAVNALSTLDKLSKDQEAGDVR